MRGMNNHAFEVAFAEIAKINLTRAKQLCRIYRSLVVAGVHAHGTVTIAELGTFRHYWWRPVGKLAGCGMQPKNHLKFKASPVLIERMSRWAGCPGMSRKTRNVTRAGHDRATLQPDPSPD